MGLCLVCLVFCFELHRAAPLIRGGGTWLLSTKFRESLHTLGGLLFLYETAYIVYLLLGSATGGVTMFKLLFSIVSILKCKTESRGLASNKQKALVKAFSEYCENF